MGGGGGCKYYHGGPVRIGLTDLVKYGGSNAPSPMVPSALNRTKIDKYVQHYLLPSHECHLLFVVILLLGTFINDVPY